MNDRLAEIEARLDAATTEGWRVAEAPNGAPSVVGEDGAVCVGPLHGREGPPNMTLIAHAPQDLRDLLNEVRRLNKEQLDQIRRLNEELPARMRSVEAERDRWRDVVSGISASTCRGCAYPDYPRCDPCAARAAMAGGDT